MSRGPAHSRRHSCAYNNGNRIKAALGKPDDGTYSSMREASRKENGNECCTQTDINASPQTVLLDHIAQAGGSATPMDHQTLRAHASEIAGRQLGKDWSRRFRKRYPDSKASQSKPVKLDQKRS